LSQTTFLVALFTPFCRGPLGELTGVAGVVIGDLGTDEAVLTGEEGAMLMIGDADLTGDIGRMGEAARTGDWALTGEEKRALLGEPICNLFGEAPLPPIFTGEIGDFDDMQGVSGSFE